MMRPEIFTASGRNIRPSWQNWPPTRTGWTKLIRYVIANFLSVYETTVIMGIAIQDGPLITLNLLISPASPTGGTGPGGREA